MTLEYGSYAQLVEAKKQMLLDQIAIRFDTRQIEFVKLAFEVASYAHILQTRKSGEPYITHPTEVATLVASWGLDEETIASALLHDVIEDTSVTKEDVEQIFGHAVAELVDGVTKLDQLYFESKEAAHAESFRKIVLAMAKDVRVIIIKLADRLHNMLTLGSMRPEKRKQIALETMEIYVPIANKIGLHKVHLQLADESFRYLHPMRYRAIEKAIHDTHKKRLPAVEEIITTIGSVLKANGLHARFIYRQHSIYNLYRRMRQSNQSFSRIYDIFEIKILVKKISDCYLTLGVLHNMYQPIPGKFKDYIAIPKSNNYQSLHSILIGPLGIPIQVHIRTLAMDEVAEKGILSQWLKHKNDEASTSVPQKTAKWINDILDIQASTFSANDFFNNLKQDLIPSNVYVFTPKGRATLLPRGSTVLDFAYFVHSDLGNHCYQARVNQRLVKPETKLHNGDIVEIITREDIEPHEDWLSIVTSGKAISKIKQYLKEQKFEIGAENGLQLLNLAISLFKKDSHIEDSMLENVTKTYYPKLSIDELKHQIGIGSISALEIAKKILNYDPNVPVQVTLSRCNLKVIQDTECLPLPGEKVLGQINRNGELVLHDLACRVPKTNGLDNFTFMHITNDVNRDFLVKVSVLMSNETGTFAKLTNLVGDKKISIIALSQELSTDETTLVNTTLRVKSITDAEELISALNHCDFIYKSSIL